MGIKAEEEQNSGKPLVGPAYELIDDRFIGGMFIDWVGENGSGVISAYDTRPDRSPTSPPPHPHGDRSVAKR